MNEIDDVRELMALFQQRDVILFVLVSLFLGIGFWAAEKLAEYERIVKRHVLPGDWARWAREDAVLEEAKRARRMRRCPRCHDQLVKGSCRKCGFE